MNVYIVVEGRRTEMSVYPAWLGILAPGLVRVHDPWEIEENNYYIFNANGIPAIFDHTVHAIEDINAINAAGKTRIDWLLVCIDTEEESREYIISQIEKRLEQKGNVYFSCRMAVFEQRVSMESWFLGNRKVFKSNPGDPDLLRYMTHCNVKDEDPELMENISEEEFATKAQFHHDYLRRIFLTSSL